MRSTFSSGIRLHSTNPLLPSFAGTPSIVSSTYDVSPPPKKPRAIAIGIRPEPSCSTNINPGTVSSASASVRAGSASRSARVSRLVAVTVLRSSVA